MIGGVLGGLGGMSGFMSAIWTQARGWKRDLRRATMQAYNISMQVLTIAIYARTGAAGGRGDVSQFLIVAPAMFIPSYIGARVYQRFSDKAFTQAMPVALLPPGAHLQRDKGALALGRASGAARPPNRAPVRAGRCPRTPRRPR